MTFRGKSHEDAYTAQIERCAVHPGDTERKALLYCLTLTEDCRQHFDSCYDKDSRLVRPDCIHEGWVTSSDLKCIRLGFNLFNGGIPTAYDLEGDEKIDELYRNTPVELFCDTALREFFFEAVRLRFEDV